MENCTIAKDPEVVRALNSLETDLSALEDRLSVLIARLCSVVRQEPQCAPEKDTEPTSSCEMAARIAGYSKEIRLMRERTDYTLSILEI